MSQNIEYESWIFAGRRPSEAELKRMGIHPSDAYYWRTTFDPRTLKIVGSVLDK
jgi:hypothetical protein